MLNNARRALAVTPSDTGDLGNAEALYIGVSGNVRVRIAETGEIVTFTSHPVGYMPVRVNRVYSTSTTATNIVALY